MAAASEPTPGAGAHNGHGTFGRWYALGLLTLAYAAHAMDRGMPGILVEPVRREFHLKDAQLGLFTGVGYGVAFAVAILPLGYLSDRTNRRNFLAAILIVWSAFTTLGGVTRSFAQLALTRIGVGAAESGASPVIIPLLTDLFPFGRRGAATGILYGGVSLGVVLGAALGGYLAAEHGWRAALFLVGLPGVIVALLILFTIKDPPRGGVGASPEPPPTFAEVIRFLASEPAVVCIIVACALIGLILIALSAWSSSFFIRVYGLSLKQTGLILGLPGLCGLVSPPFWGWLADRLAKRHGALPLTLTWATNLTAVAASLIWLFVPYLPLAIAGFVVGDLLRQGYPALAFPVVMERTPAKMRGVVMSTLQLTTNLVGFGFGPVMLGALSDYYGGGRSIRYAMADALLITLLVVALLIAAVRLIRGAPDRALAPTVSA